MKILVVDIGGSSLKILASGQSEPRKTESDPNLTPSQMVQKVRELAEGWEYEGVSIGYPGLVGSQGPRSDPGNLGDDWVNFDYAGAFSRPVKIINDAAMQALGSYEGGRMLFLGLGTGLGSTVISPKVIVPLELGRLWSKAGGSLGDTLGRKGLERLGEGPWCKAVIDAATTLKAAFVADDVVLGGGNAERLKHLPKGLRQGHNDAAFRGGFRLWNLEDVAVLTPGNPAADSARPSATDPWKTV